MAKYTDEQIKKALECCINKRTMCKQCPLYCIDILNCNEKIAMAYALYLINRQEAEIERLRKQLQHAEVCIDELEYAYEKVGDSNSRVDEAFEKYNLVKEMVGEGE